MMTSSVERRQHVTVFPGEAAEQWEQILEDTGVSRMARLYQSIQFVWLVTGVLELLIGLRILLKLIAATPDNHFIRLAYDLSDLFLWPFHGLTAASASNTMILEIGSLFAMSVYIVLASVVAKMIYLAYTPAS